MIRRVLSGAGLLAMVMGGMVFAQGGVAGAATPVTLSGTITCAVTGTVKFSPGLVNGGTTADTVSAKAKLTGCSGPGASGDGVTLSSGHLAVTATTTINNNCGAVFNGSALPQLTGTLKWKGSGGMIEASSISITDGSIFYDVNGDNGAGSFDVFLPTSVSSGSYSGESGSPSGLSSDKAGGTTDAKCASRGVKGITVGKPDHTITGSVTIEESGPS
jgi:hypothetical protein